MFDSVVEFLNPLARRFETIEAVERVADGLPLIGLTLNRIPDFVRICVFSVSRLTFLGCFIAFLLSSLSFLSCLFAFVCRFLTVTFDLVSESLIFIIYLSYPSFNLDQLLGSVELLVKGFSFCFESVDLGFKFLDLLACLIKVVDMGCALNWLAASWAVAFSK